MGNFLTAMGILACVAFTAFAYYQWVHDDYRALLSLWVGFAIAGIAVLIWLIHVFYQWFSKRYVRRPALKAPNQADRNTPLTNQLESYSPKLRQAVIRLRKLKELV